MNKTFFLHVNHKANIDKFVINDVFKKCYKTHTETCCDYTATMMHLDIETIFKYINNVRLMFPKGVNMYYYKTPAEMDEILETNHEEQAYIDLMHNIVEDGLDKPNRTINASRSITGALLRFKLTRNGKMILPLLTTKRVSFRLVATELLWFLKGTMVVADLQKVNNHIWDANGSKSFLKIAGFDNRQEFDMGPIYGAQWRHWNSPYQELLFRSKNFKMGGIDQIANVIESIKKDPWSRRHIVSAWNVEQIPLMVLPPCHVLFQFIVRPNKQKTARREYEPTWLDCVLYQRSADIPLGVPYNIVSYSLLTHMIAHICGLKAGEFIHDLADTHVYLDQFEGCRKQLTRKPYKFPNLEFINAPDDIDKFSMENFKITNYKCHPIIKYPFTC